MALEKGRKYVPETVERVCEALRKGATRLAAAGCARIDETTLTRWVRIHPEFAGAVKAAEAEAEQTFTAALYDAAVGGDGVVSLTGRPNPPVPLEVWGGGKPSPPERTHVIFSPLPYRSFLAGRGRGVLHVLPVHRGVVWLVPPRLLAWQAVPAEGEAATGQWIRSGRCWRKE